MTQMISFGLYKLANNTEHSKAKPETLHTKQDVIEQQII
jgi:hypothetical protein